mgnify:CR=1 FL=1|jgi:hypothetical protein
MDTKPNMKYFLVSYTIPINDCEFDVIRYCMEAPNEAVLREMLWVKYHPFDLKSHNLSIEQTDVSSYDAGIREVLYAV